MKFKYLLFLNLVFLIVSLFATAAPKDNSRKREKTAFQTAGPWKPVTDVRSDVAIVYGTVYCAFRKLHQIFERDPD